MAQAAARPVAARAAQAATRAAQAATRPVAARVAQAGAAEAGAAELAAGTAARWAVLGRIGGALARAPLGELLFIPGVLRDMKRNNDTYGAGALAWLTHDKAMRQRAAARIHQAARPPPAAARPAGFQARARAEPGPHAPLEELAAFARALSADASAMLAHARALSALAATEIAATGRVAMVSTTAGAASAGAESARHTTIHFNQTNHVQNPTDAKGTARELHRLGVQDLHRALHDGADG